MKKLIHSQRVYDRGRDLNRPVHPTSADLAALRRYPDERAALAGDSLVKLLEDPEEVWSRWDVRKGASLETYFVNAMVQRFQSVFRTWQTHRRTVISLPAVDLNFLSDRSYQADPAVDVVARDALRRALRAASPEVRATVVLIVAGYQHGEIADRLQISERGVEGRLYRFRKQIRDAPLAGDLLEALREQTAQQARQL
ncbi:sigma factor-like helix-turn-helix DNA-binding protein [Streptomyces sp. NPDC059900]|uniref:RNA polymerase sigma factor n=1 Tax=Streptomyces sp. NPDC059900 TaxID=3155816 RepID=UPI0034136DC2